MSILIIKYPQYQQCLNSTKNAHVTHSVHLCVCVYVCCEETNNTELSVVIITFVNGGPQVTVFNFHS